MERKGTNLFSQRCAPRMCRLFEFISGPVVWKPNVVSGEDMDSIVNLSCYVLKVCIVPVSSFEGYLNILREMREGQ